MNIELDKAVHTVDLTEPTELIKQLEAIGYAVVPKYATCGGCAHFAPFRFGCGETICRSGYFVNNDTIACIGFTPNPSNSGELKSEVKQ